jgi:hypothetical protein
MTRIIKAVRIIQNTLAHEQNMKLKLVTYYRTNIIIIRRRRRRRRKNLQ